MRRSPRVRTIAARVATRSPRKLRFSGRRHRLGRTKAPTATNTDKAAVWLRIVNTTKKFSHVSVDGVDPFSKNRVRIEPGMPLQAETRVQSDRDSFSDLPSREVHFYRSEADLRAERPTLTVYYLGVPGQTPEFSTRAALDSYLGTAKLAKHLATP